MDGGLNAEISNRTTILPEEYVVNSTNENIGERKGQKAYLRIRREWINPLNTKGRSNHSAAISGLESNWMTATSITNLNRSMLLSY